MRFFDQVDSASVEKREFQLAVFSLAVIAVLMIGTGILMYPILESHSAMWSARTTKIAFVGFCALSLLLLGYLVDRQVVVQRLRREIREAEVRYTELHKQVGKDLIGTLAGMNPFQDRLSMEFRRAVNLRDTLSVMVIRLTPHPNIVKSGELVAALGDAVKAITRKLRREDSLYHFSEGVFGVMLPGVSVQNARIAASRLTEGLRDVSGAVDRFTHEVKIFNYPQHVATASELENSVRGMLPAEMVSEPSVAEAFETREAGTQG
jgi:GGDEF domain-containing protein